MYVVVVDRGVAETPCLVSSVVARKRNFASTSIYRTDLNIQYTKYAFSLEIIVRGYMAG